LLGGVSRDPRGFREFRAEKIGRDGFTFQKGGGGQSVGNTRQVSALRKKGKPSRRKEPPGASVPDFFGGRERKSGRGTKREETASNVRRMKTWKVHKLMRARSPFLPEQGGRAGGCR
jgi:hypothetical protein